METVVETTQPAPVLADAFFADRLAFWDGFTGFVKWGAIAIAVLLILMALFLG